MFRSICAVILGVVAWVAVATVGNLVLRQFLPGYAAVEVAMNFTLAMLVARLALGLVSSLCAGAVAAAISRSGRLAARVVAVGMVLLFLPVHYFLWEKFPLWYHAFFLASLAPAALLGAAIQRGRSSLESPR